MSSVGSSYRPKTVAWIMFRVGPTIHQGHKTIDLYLVSFCTTVVYGCGRVNCKTTYCCCRQPVKLCSATSAVWQPPKKQLHTHIYTSPYNSLTSPRAEQPPVAISRDRFLREIMHEESKSTLNQVFHFYTKT